MECGRDLHWRKALLAPSPYPKRGLGRGVTYHSKYQFDYVDNRLEASKSASVRSLCASLLPSPLLRQRLSKNCVRLKIDTHLITTEEFMDTLSLTRACPERSRRRVEG